jgi:hypothetical protein
MARKSSRKRRGKTRERPQWPAVVAAVVAAVSLGLNGYQYFDNRKLEHRIDEATAAKIEHEIAVELEARYLVVPGPTIGRWPADLVSDRKNPRVVENEVLASLREFAERAEVGGPVLEEFEHGAVVKAHAGVVLRIRNEGAVTARSLWLVARGKDFPATGEVGAQVWEIDTSGWAEKRRRLADLAPGQEVYFPLLHLVGSNRYLGAAYLPVRLTWQNVATHKAETMQVQPMAPEDQWIAEGLDVKIAQ